MNTRYTKTSGRVKFNDGEPIELGGDYQGGYAHQPRRLTPKQRQARDKKLLQSVKPLGAKKGGRS